MTDMKKFFKYFAGIAAAAALFACSPYEDYTTASYVVIDASALEVPEGPYKVAGADTLIAIPVWLHNNKTGCTVTYTVTDNTATVGTDYTLVDNSGTITFDPGKDSTAIEIKVTGQPGVFTQNVDFTVTLASATNEVPIGAINTCKVTIKDFDHPLTKLFGTYTMYQINLSTTPAYAYAKFPITISQYAGDPTKVWISDIIYFTYTYASYLTASPAVYADVSSDMKTITIPVPQTTKAHGDDMFNEMKEDDFFTLYAVSGTNPDKLEWDTKEGKITFTLQEDGSYLTNDSFALNVPSFVAKPDWLYYWMFALSSYNSDYPTRFVKE